MIKGSMIEQLMESGAETIMRTKRFKNITEVISKGMGMEGELRCSLSRISRQWMEQV